MDDSEQTREQSEPAATARPAVDRKRPYVKPAFTHERAFETMALSCGKINSTQISCKLNKKHS